MPRRSAADSEFSPSTTRPLIRPPADLNALERAEFIAVVAGSPPNHFLPADSATISAYARCVVAERVAAGELAAAPVIDGKASAWLPVWLGALRGCTTLARRLNINPAGRVRVASKSAEPPAPITYFERQAMERAMEGQGNGDESH